MKHLRERVLACLFIGAGLFAACGGGDDSSREPIDRPSPTSTNCAVDKPVRPGGCDWTCTGDEFEGAFCENMGSGCSFTVNGCTYKAVCTDNHTWTGATTCKPVPDAGMDDAGMEEAGTPPCLKCGDYISTIPIEGTICPESEALLMAFTTCICERGSADIPPGCMDGCLDNACIGAAATKDCGNCATNGPCAVETNDCTNDL